jgi:hypothetical protein
MELRRNTVESHAPLFFLLMRTGTLLSLPLSFPAFHVIPSTMSPISLLAWPFAFPEFLLSLYVLFYSSSFLRKLLNIAKISETKN